jgi:pimeloyl-ACP methyl ester carboxylesterase
MPSFLYDDIRFEYLERATGTPVIFQHGMGGNAERVTQPLTSPGFRLLSFDFRGHGKTTAIGSQDKLKEAFIGGNSMGAGVALNLALRYPERVKGLILLRPAWLDYAYPENLKVYITIMNLIRQHGSEKAKLCLNLVSFTKTSNKTLLMLLQLYYLNLIL